MTDKPPKPGIYRVGLEYPIMLPHAIKNIYDNPRTDIVIRSYVSAEGRNVVLMDTRSCPQQPYTNQQHTSISAELNGSHGNRGS